MIVTMLPHARLTPAVMLCRRMMKLGDLIVALDIDCGTYVPHTKREEEGLMTFAMKVDAS